MPRRPKYSIVYVAEVDEHLDFIDNRHYGLIAAAISQQRSYSPEAQTRNRKPLAQAVTFGATWELRFGPKNSFRVFYDVRQAEKVVTVLAIGRKEGNRLFIGGEEFEL